MFYRWRKRYRMLRFNRQIADILDAPPIRLVDAPLTIITMVSNFDVSMYLLGLKSFYARLGRGKVVAIIDRDMPQSLRDILRRHVEGIRFQVLEDIDTGACQRGGTWERLVYVLNHSRNEYAIQLDSDTLAFGKDISEVLACIERNLAFTMSDNLPIVSLRMAADQARAHDSNYIGIVAERAFNRHPDVDRLKYVRGSSGFAGFARAGFDPGHIQEFHQVMSGLVGDRWREWGTEQCGSNFAIANSSGAVALPFPQYSSFYPGGPRYESKLMHFIGAHRFDEGFFASRGRQVVAELKV
jgi:hypothetical protein